MNLSKFCEFFEFGIEKGRFKDEDGIECKFKATDYQACFHDRFGEVPDDFTGAFESMHMDYIDSTLDDYGVPYVNGYSEAVAFIDSGVPDLVDTDTYHVMKVIAGLEQLEDDLAA